jgi:hypothetical protein
MMPKRQNLLHLLFFTGMVTLLVSCNKTEDFDDLDLLTGKDWRLTSRMMDGVEISDSCDLDDVLRFSDAESFSHNWGAVACNPITEDRSADSWKLQDDFSVIRMKYKFSGDEGVGSMMEYWEIIELSDTALVLKDATAEDNDQVPEFRTYE